MCFGRHVTIRCVCVVRELVEFTCFYRVSQSDEVPELIAPEVPGSIPGAARFSEKQRLWNGVHSAS
jgi:hypothetical protein